MDMLKSKSLYQNNNNNFKCKLNNLLEAINKKNKIIFLFKFLESKTINKEIKLHLYK